MSDPAEPQSYLPGDLPYHAAMNQAEAKIALVKEWLYRPSMQRKAEHVRIFYDELTAADSPLLSFDFAGNRRKCVAAWLKPHVES